MASAEAAAEGEDDTSGLTCANCHKGGEEVSLKVCSLCKEVYYCSRECQKKNFKAHKQVCKGSKK